MDGSGSGGILYFSSVSIRFFFNELPDIAERNRFSGNSPEFSI